MSIKIDPATRTITLPIGDTGSFVVDLTDEDGNALTDAVTGTAKFAICKRNPNGSCTTKFGKDVEIVDNTVPVALTNSDTQDLPPGEYNWDIRVMTEPETDEDDDAVETDDVGEVHSLFALTGMPKFVLLGVASDV